MAKAKSSCKVWRSPSPITRFSGLRPAMPPEFLLDPNGAAVIARLARALGESGNEVALLLAGSRTPQRPVQLDRILVPRQTALNSDRGCGLIVDGGCLNRLGPQMRQASRSIYGILHSHPTEAYHSPPIPSCSSAFGSSPTPESTAAPSRSASSARRLAPPSRCG